MIDSITVQVEAVLEEIRPYIRSHGGEVNLVEVRDGVVRLQLLGACDGCPASMVTLHYGIERLLQERVPAIHAVEAVSADDFDGFGADSDPV